MDWNTVLNNWENDIIFKYPTKLKNRFQWNTSVLKNNGNSKYLESYKTNMLLPEKQSYNSFREYIVSSTNKYVTSFKNPSKDTLLVIPMPRSGKNYATIKDFCDNAPIIQQKEFWKTVAKLAKIQMKNETKVWVSAHGLGVSYFHIRICNNPKYYFDSNLSKE